MNIRYPVLLLVGTVLWLSAWAAAPAAAEKKPAAAPAAGAPPSSREMRQAVERSLVFLEKSANDWYEHGQLHSVEFKDGRKIMGGTVQKKCVSCHHLPMTVWALTEAREHGFTVDDRSLDRLRDQALAPHLRTPDLKPSVGNQDSRGDSKTVMNTIYLSIAAQAAGKPDEQALDAMKKFAAHLIDMQEADGGWSQLKELKSDALATGQTLYVLAVVGSGSAEQRRAIERAQAFLMDTQLKDGSWWVPTRNALSKGRKGQASSHHGSGWATVGLIRNLGKKPE